MFAAGKSTGVKLPRSAPEAEGVSSKGILQFLDAVGRSQHEFHSFMMLRHGKVIAEGWWEPYRAGAPHMLYSLSKSFTSTGVGLAVAERRLTVDDKVIRFFPNDVPGEVSPNLARLRVKDLLSMSVGHAQDSTGSLWGETNWVRKFLALPVQNEPGTAFLYNSGATYMCSAIVQTLADEKLVDYLRPRLFEPLGISGETWEQCPRGFSTGGWGLKLQTEALAKFGQLYLQRGKWNGRQILTESWVAEATSFKIQQPSPDLEKARTTSDWHQGYCYQFWRCRHDAFRGDGAYGQFTIVMPAQEAVIVITSESPNMQGQLDLVWEHLLPAIQGGNLARDRQAERALEERLGSLKIPAAKGQGGSSLENAVNGRTYKLEDNPGKATELRISSRRGRTEFVLIDAKGEHRVECGQGRWLDGVTTMPGMPPKLTRGDLGPVSKVAASSGWKDDQTLEMRWQFYETPHHALVTCRFADGGRAVTVEMLGSLAKMSKQKPETTLRGSMRV